MIRLEPRLSKRIGSGMQISVKLLGVMAQLMARRELLLDFATGPVTCDALKKRLLTDCAEHARMLSACRLAVNHEFARPDQMVHERDEVALIGMISGG